MKTIALILATWFLLYVGYDTWKTDQQRRMFVEAMKQRERRGLPKQILDKDLCEKANHWARYMANTGRFAHGGGEQIIARGYKTPEQAINAWMRSDGHRRWLLSRTTHVGFGFARSKNGHPYYVGVYRNKVKR